MKWRAVLASLSIIGVAALLSAHRSAAVDEPALARYAPPGAMLYLEARDFCSLLAQWNGSQQKSVWRRSANYEMFSRSRLFLRLKEAGDQFAAAAGLPPDMNFASQVAGSQSAVALYDIGNLQFLYITKLEPGKAEQTALIQSRSKFETRSAAGATFYYRKDEEKKREVAFAVSGGYLLLATREDLMTGALELMAGSGKSSSIESEAWWTRPVAAAGPPGDLRLVLNLEKIVPSPYFRSYWVQKNITAMKAYSAAVSDLHLSSTAYHEERVLVKKEGSAAESAAGDGSAAVAELAPLVPADAGSYQIVATPPAAETLSRLEAQLLAPATVLGPAAETAPQVALTSGETGGGGDLETRIDQPPVATGPQTAPSEPLTNLLAQNPVRASLQVWNTELDKDGVFVRVHSALVLLGSSDWNESSARAAIGDFVRPLLTTGALGAGWRQKAGHQELDGLWPLAVAVRGKALILADDSRLLSQFSSNGKHTTGAQPAMFLAGWSHARERARFVRMTRLLDGQSGGEEGEASRVPEFFSGNMASLSSVLAGFSSQKVVVRDAGDKVLQSVAYEWAE
jgi:hypothetical protein